MPQLRYPVRQVGDRQFLRRTVYTYVEANRQLQTEVTLKLFAAGMFLAAAVTLSAGVIQIGSPGALTGSFTTINFDGALAGSTINNLYSAQGVQLTRDDGRAVVALDWAAFGSTTSNPNVMATIGLPYSTSANFIFSIPVNEIGMYFGNDEGGPDYTMSTLYAYDALNNLIGNVSVNTNNNTSVDQYIGLLSTVTIARARILNTGNTYAVVVDDLAFGTSGTSVPEPSTLWLVLLAAPVALYRRRRPARM